MVGCGERQIYRLAVNPALHRHRVGGGVGVGDGIISGFQSRNHRRRVGGELNATAPSHRTTNPASVDTYLTTNPIKLTPTRPTSDPVSVEA
jgi:hypothetical protein